MASSKRCKGEELLFWRRSHSKVFLVFGAIWKVSFQTWNLSQILHHRIFRLKILHRQFHLISTVLVRKNTKNEWKWRNLHRWQKFYTAAGTDGTDKFHLWTQFSYQYSFSMQWYMCSTHIIWINHNGVLSMTKCTNVSYLILLLIAHCGNSNNFLQ